MKRLLMMVVALMASRSFGGGFAITMENDFFLKNDNNYSHNTEIEYIRDPVVKDKEVYRVNYGAHQSMYTPTNIKSPDMPPQSSRPWCGILTVFREVDYISNIGIGDELVRARLEVGVLGPWSGSEYSQKGIHKVLDNAEPRGWDNQMPNEPAINFYYERYNSLMKFGKEAGWSARTELVYGGTLGTTFINQLTGGRIVFGYNIPSFSMPAGIEPKEVRSPFFVYGSVQVDNVFVRRNATLGDSFFRDREPGQERSLKSKFWQNRYGVTAGYKDLSLTYQIGHREEEFVGQDDGGMDWGMVRIEWSKSF